MEAFAIYTLWGIGSGAFWPSQSALLAALTPARRRAPAYALQRLAMNVGVALGGVVAGLIAVVGDPETFTVLFAINCVTFVGYMIVLAWVRAPALHEGRLGGSWRAVVRDRVFTALHTAQRRLHDGRDLAGRGTAAGVRQERHRDQREGGRASCSRSTRWGSPCSSSRW